MGRERARGIDIGGGGGGRKGEKEREVSHLSSPVLRRTVPDVQDGPGRSRTRTSSGQKILVFRTVQDEDVLNIFGSMLSGEGCRSCTVLALAVTVIKPCLNRKFTVILP